MKYLLALLSSILLFASAWAGGPVNVNTASAEEIAEGVEDMQILYGVDTNGDGLANQYVTANKVLTATAGGFKLDGILCLAFGPHKEDSASFGNRIADQVISFF